MNIAQAIQYLYPQAVWKKDFIVQDDGDGPYISIWNIDAPRPTEAELQAAYEEWEARPIEKTPEQIRIEELEAELALQNTNNTAFIEFVLQTLGVE